MNRRRQAASHLVCGLGGAAGGAALAHFLDPDRGHARRARLRDQFAARLRQGWRTGRRAGWRRARRIGGRWSRWRHAFHQRTHPAVVAVDDVTLAATVRSHLRHAGQPIKVDAADGVVHLRGEVSSDAEITRLAEAVRAMTGVAAVENFLHLPGEIAPNKAAVAQLGR